MLEIAGGILIALASIALLITINEWFWRNY